jgi:4-amino-4-deoxy-L-arabinose transferase-like glycosyltransferase
MSHFGRGGQQEMNPGPKAVAMWKQLPLWPLILVVAINATAFFLFPQISGAVGADTGTDGYKEIAENIVQGNGFVYSPDRRSTIMTGFMKREPVYPLFLSGILAVTGGLRPAVLGVCQTLLSLVACAVLYRLGVAVFDDATAGIAAYIYALHPLSFWYSTRFASEIVGVPVLLICLLIIHAFLTEPTPRRAFLCGLLIGVGALTKSAYIVLLPLVVIFVAVRPDRRFRRLRLCAIVICIYASVHSLWIVRNYRLSGEFVPFTTMNGVMFFVGNRNVETFDVKAMTSGIEPDRWANGMYESVQADIAAQQPDISLARLEAETDKRMRAQAAQLIATAPSFIVRKVAAGTALIWFLSDSSSKSMGWAIFQVPLLTFAIVGMYRCRRRTASTRFLVAFIALFVLSYTVMSPLARYAMPIAPLLMLFAAHGLTGLARPFPSTLRQATVGA